MPTAEPAPINIGDIVRTTQEDVSMRHTWNGPRTGCQWGAQGQVIATHGAHGLYYDVQHQDGFVAGYEPTELEVVKKIPKEGEMDEVDEILTEAVGEAKTMLKMLTADKEFVNLTAKVCRQMYDALLTEGFTSEQAIQIVANNSRFNFNTRG